MLKKAPLSFDILVVALFLIIPILFYSIYLVKKKKRYDTHKKLQIFISMILGVAITIFEVDIRFQGWRHLVTQSKYYHTILWPSFYIHLFCAVITTILWIMVFVRALQKFSRHPQPNGHSYFHKKLAPWATSGLIITTITGITFYYVAFS